MKTSLKGRIEIASHEGLCQTKYKDSVGVWTIAIGATRGEIPDLASWPMDKKLSIKECFELFEQSLAKYERAVNKVLTKPIKQYEFDALVSWCYNVGPGWLTRATVIKRINSGETGKRLYDALMMYRKPPEIIGRRKKEANLLAYGNYDYGGGNTVNVFPVSKSGRPLYSKGKQIDPLDYLKPSNPPPQLPDKGFEKTKINKNAAVITERSWIVRVFTFLFERIFQEKK